MTKRRISRYTVIAAVLAVVVSCASVKTLKQAVVEPYDIENEGTRKYLEEVDYASDTAYTLSFAKEYMQQYGANDKPRPVFIAWTDGPASRILLATNPGFVDAVDVQATASPAEIYNLIPGEKYYYKVLGINGEILKSGGVMPVGPLRMINGIADNVRDLGGWKVPGGHIAYGRLYRGARLSSRMSDGGKDIFLRQLGISVDLDLRGIKESEANAGPVIEGVEYLKLPVEKNLGRGTGNTQELYQQAIRSIIGWLDEGRNIYFHCAGGADRTGSLAFLIEALLGVSESDLSKDYELTTFARTNTRLRNFRATESETHILYELIGHVRKFGYPAEADIHQLVLNWATTRHSDSVDPLTSEETARLRKLLIVREK